MNLPLLPEPIFRFYNRQSESSLPSYSADQMREYGQQCYEQALEPCNVCGWKAIVPGEPCLMCERNAKMLLPEYVPLSDAEIDALGVRGIEQFHNLYNHVPWAGELKMYVRQLARAIEQEVRGK